MDVQIVSPYVGFYNYQLDTAAAVATSRAINDELAMLSNELTRAFGLDGRDRRAGSAAERARINVNRMLTRAIRRIASASPELGRYLESTVRTGTFCVYLPDERLPIRWEL